MVLVDTSVWVSYLRSGNNLFSKLLDNEEVICHPFIIGELACGNIKNRDEIFSLLHSLPMLEVIDNTEILQFIENYKIMGKGIGLVDIHLLASAFFNGITLWTIDNKLNTVLLEFNLDYKAFEL